MQAEGRERHDHLLLGGGLLQAERPAHVGLYHPYRSLPDPQCRSQECLHLVGLLGRFPEREQIGYRVVLGDDAARFDRHPGQALRLDPARGGVLRRRHGCVEVPGFETVGHEHVVVPRRFDPGRPRPERRLGGADSFEDVVLDTDLRDGGPGDVGVGGDDRGNGLSQVAGPALGDRVPVDPPRSRLGGVPAFGNRPGSGRHVGRKDDIDNPVDGQRSGGVHRYDPCVGIGTTDHRQVMHVFPPEVPHVLAVAPRQAAIVGADPWGTDRIPDRAFCC